MAIGMQKKAAGMGIPIRMEVDSKIYTVGNFGTDNKTQYTIIRNVVNSASRLKAVADVRKILVSEAAMNASINRSIAN